MKTTKYKTVDYERLPEVYDNFTGVGIPGLTAKLVMRTDKKAMYHRSDDVWEVFRIKIAEAEVIFDKHYPRREVYPCNEEFGVSAWECTIEANAIKRYNAI